MIHPDHGTVIHAYRVASARLATVKLHKNPLRTTATPEADRQLIWQEAQAAVVNGHPSAQHKQLVHAAWIAHSQGVLLYAKQHNAAVPKPLSASSGENCAQLTLSAGAIAPSGAGGPKMADRHDVLAQLRLDYRSELARC